MSQIVRSKSDLKDIIREVKKKNSTIGLVPTMGALHQGHLSLVQMSKTQYDVTVVTIFINPAQFNNPSDLEKYPRTEKNDIALLSKAGCDYIFMPKAEEIYLSKPIISLNFGHLETIMEGQQRPGHFNGVALIVMKLMGLIEPNGAYFGQKDLQQFRIVSTLIRDFDMAIKLHMAPIIREISGLAMSSRNKRLSKTQRQKASLIYAALTKAKEHLKKGAEINEVKKKVAQFFVDENTFELAYFEIVKSETLQNISIVNEGDRLALCIAVMVAKIRLIDNIIIDI